MSSKKKIVKKVNIKDENIKYNVKNTALPVIITHDGKVYFDVDPGDEKRILAKDQETITDYQEKVKSTMEYLFLEGFLSDPEEVDPAKN